MHPKELIRKFLCKHGNTWLLRYCHIDVKPLTHFSQNKNIHGDSIATCVLPNIVGNKFAHNCICASIILFFEPKYFCNDYLTTLQQAYLLHEMGHMYRSMYYPEHDETGTPNDEEYAHMWAVKHAYDNSYTEIYSMLVDMAKEMWTSNRAPYHRIYKQICCEGYCNDYPF